MAGQPPFSVIVVTYKREGVLCDTLEHLLALSYPKYELIVVDQTPVHEPETEQRLQAYVHHHPDRLQMYRISQANMPHARNIGAEKAQGEYLLYCDDDIVPPADLIERHLLNLVEPRVGAVTGGIRVERHALPPQERACVLLPNGRIYQYWDHEVPKGITHSLLGCNMSVPRQLAFDVGLFDDGYIGRATWEEVDFSFRIRRSGYHIAYDPSAAVTHLAHPTGGARAGKDLHELRYYYEGHYNNAYFFAKNIPQRYVPLFLKRELGWILIKQAILHRHPQRTVPSLRGLWDGYRAGLRRRQS